MSGGSIPAPDGLEYLNYQRDGIRFALERAASLNADEPGLGKTVQAAGLMNASGARRVLIACPASLRLNWKRELDRWKVRPLEVAIASPGWPDADVVVASYEFLARHLAEPRAERWDLLVVDEAHLTSANPKAARSVGILGRKRYRKQTPVAPLKARRRLFLTGTPIVNRPIEIQPVLASIDRAAWGDRMAFARKYCAARHNGFGWDFSGASNLDELHARLAETCMIRRRKADVLAELPPKRRQIVELPADGAAEAVALERRALGPAAAEALDATTPEERAAAIARLAKAARHKFAEIGPARKAIGLAKVEAACEFAIGLAESGAKAVLFAHHLAVIDALVERLGQTRWKAVKLDSRDSPAERDRSVRAFQGDPGVRYFVGSVTAAGVGLTLTQGHDVLFVEADWRPGVMSQAEDRAHRFGQRSAVLSRWLVLEGSVDAMMCRAIHEKSAVIDAAIDGSARPEPATPLEQFALGL